MNSNPEFAYTVSVGMDRLLLHQKVYDATFQEVPAVRLGAHTELPLIYIKPVDSPSTETYTVSDRRYDAVVSCKGFLCANNFHHQSTQRYRAASIEDISSLVVDLSTPVMRPQQSDP